MDDDHRRVLGVRAANAVDQAESLASLDPSWGTEVHGYAGGWLILSGAGMYVNRAIGAGTETGLSRVDVDALVTLSEAVGVVAAFEVTPATHRETIEQLRTAGFAPDASADVSVLTRPVDGPPIEGPDDVGVHPVGSEADLRLWQATSAIGWGHTTAPARRASDAFAAAISALDNEHLVVAVDRASGRPVGCACTTVRDGIATFGGMSTVPTERRRGVQAALLRYRMDLAARLRCDLAATTAVAGGPSERNLRRHGFVRTMTIETYSPAPSG